MHHSSSDSVSAVGETRLLMQASEAFPRHSEAAFARLSDGRLLLTWGRKPDGDDFSQAMLLGVVSRDDGITWEEPARVVREVWEGVIDVMSPNFCRSPRGLHFIFLGRNPPPEGRPRYHSLSTIYQSISTDEGETWSHPEPISQRKLYHIINNDRVIRTSTGRIIAPLAFVAGPIFELYDQQAIFCLYSDDDGITWKESNEVRLPNAPLMEPGVVECVDGSLYMTIRTKLGHLYEARSYDGGATWEGLGPSALISGEAPATVCRDPNSANLWMFWCNTPYTPGVGAWWQRHDVAFALSKDNGRSWSTPVTLEHDLGRSFGYVSVVVSGDFVILAYYDWQLDPNISPQEKAFHGTSLRQRRISLAWFREENHC